MSDRVRTAMQRLSTRLVEEASTAVTYRRGSSSLSNLAATMGTQVLRVLDSNGNTRTVRTERDFTFEAADLILDGRTTTPEDGDLIDVDLGGSETERYEVMPVGTDASWRYSDSHNIRIRVHTKRIGKGV